MRIIDSNVIIYATQKQFDFLNPILRDKSCFVSEITKLEVLGYHKFDTVSKQLMTELFDTLQIIPINSPIINQAILLRQNQKMSIGDAIIAATALLNNFEIVTRNTLDFKSLNIKVFNPMIWLKQITRHRPLQLNFVF